MNKYTPGPWMSCGQGVLGDPVTGLPVITEVIESKGWGRIGEWYDYSNEQEANVRLITCAPDILEQLRLTGVALANMVDCFRGVEGRSHAEFSKNPYAVPEFKDALKQINAVHSIIRKAKGE